MSAFDEHEILEKEVDENISVADKAKIIGIEEIIDELKDMNSNLDFNNSNITNLRQEINLLRKEKSELGDDTSSDLSEIIEYTRKSSLDLEIIRQIVVLVFIANLTLAFIGFILWISQ